MKPIEAGTIFGIPLSDGSICAAQVVDRVTSRALRCLAFDVRTSSVDSIASSSLIESFAIGRAIVFDTRIRNLKWPAGPVAPIRVPTRLWPYEETMNKGWVGATISDPVLFEAFVNAWYGLRFWDDWYDPNYLSAFMIDKSAKSRFAVYKNSQSG